MPERILGLDIGESAVKAALVSRDGKARYRIIKTASISISDNGRVSEALGLVFADEAFRNAVCATSLPARDILFRNITLPFRQEKQIQQTIAYRMEPLIHHPIDDVFISYLVKKYSDHSDILSAAVIKSFLLDRVKMLEPFVKRIASIEIDAVPVAMQIAAAGAQAGCNLLLDIGHRNSVAVYLVNGQITYVRNIGFGGGGGDITRAIAESLGIDFPAAEEKKRAGTVHADSDCAKPAYQRFFKDLNDMGEILLWNGHLDQKPSKLLLTGGGALHQGLKKALSQYFSIPIELADLNPAPPTRVVQLHGNSWDTTLNQVYALAVRQSRKEKGFDFRGLLPDAQRGAGQTEKLLKGGIAAALLILFLGGVEASLDLWYSQRNLSRIKSEINAVVKTYCPEITRIVDPVQQLKNKIAEDRRMLRGLTNSAPQAAVLDILKEITTRVPPSAELLITSFNVENGIIMVRGEAKHFSAVDDIKKELAKSNLFDSVVIGATNLSKQGSKVEFDLKIGLKK